MARRRRGLVVVGGLALGGLALAFTRTAQAKPTGATETDDEANANDPNATPGGGGGTVDVRPTTLSATPSVPGPTPQPPGAQTQLQSPGLPGPVQPEPDPEQPDDTVQVHFDVPRPGAFYQIESGVSLTGMVRSFLDNLVPGSGASSRNRMAVIRCLNASAWNDALYGTTSKSSGFPGYYNTHEGRGLRVAFLPGNPDAIEAITAARWPGRGYAVNGAPFAGSGRSHGLLWFPVLDLDALERGEILCSQTSPQIAFWRELEGVPEGLPGTG